MSRRPATRSGLIDTLAPPAIALATLGAAAGLVVLASRADPVPPPAVREVIAVDLSGTVPTDDLCPSVARLEEQALAVVPRGGLTVHLVGTGDRTSGRQMRPTATAQVAIDNNPLTGGGVPAEQLERARQELGEGCAGLGTLDESPLKDTLEGAINLVRIGDRPCSEPAVACRVWFKTDGVETHDPALRVALGLDRVRRGQTAPAVVQLDNTDVDIVFCGLSQRVLAGRAARGPAPSLAELEAAWLPHFEDPDRVSFHAVCAPAAPPVVSAATQP